VGVANANLKPPDKHITFIVEPCPIVISSRAVTTLALVLNEMVSNAIKHGMAGQTEGVIAIRGWEEEGMVIVQVIDTGSGPPFDLPSEETSEGGVFEGLGLSLIKHLTGDLDGHFSLRREVIQESNVEHPDQEIISAVPIECTVAEVRFPLVRHRRA
jgi:two-component sensor histidine kinase